MAAKTIPMIMRVVDSGGQKIVPQIRYSNPNCHHDGS